MEHLALRGVQGLKERGIKQAERFLVSLERRADGLFTFVETAGERSPKRFLFHLRAKVLRPGEKIAYLKTVLGEKACDRRLDDGEARTRDNRAHAAEDFAIQHLRLSHVGDLRRASEVRRGRKQRILHHRTQQSTRSEGLGRGVKRGAQLRARELGVAGKEFSVAAAKRLAAAGNFVK